MSHMQDRCLSQSPPQLLDFDKWQKLVDLMARLYGAACGAVVQLRQGEFNTVAASKNEDNFIGRDSSWPWDMESFCRRIIETRKGLYVNNALGDKCWSQVEPVSQGPVRSYLGMPIFWPDDTIFGTICVIDTKSSDYDDNLVELLEQLSYIISSDLRLIYDYENVQAMAFTDELTKAYNRHGLKAHAQASFALAQASNLSVGLIYFDLDDLKLINDNYGHSVGDGRLKALAELLQRNCREQDLIARLGGDEFVLLLFDAQLEQVEACASRIEREYAELDDLDSCPIEKSISYGIQTYIAGSNMDLEQMISLADEQMYKHKRARKVMAR